MCGIVGIIGPNAPRNVVKTIFRNLLLETQIRGKDATGVAATMDDGSSLLHARNHVAAEDFVKSDEYKKVVNDYTGGVLIGHCRRTTKGTEKDNINNHPIISDRTGIGVIHNGTVQDKMWRVVDEDDKTNPYILDVFTSQVDTEAIVRLVDTMWYIPREEDGSVNPDTVSATPKNQWKKEVNLNTAIRDATFNLTGGMSCALLNPTQPNDIRLWRVKNPCVIAFVPDYEMLVFASTEEILRKSLRIVEYEESLNYFFVPRDTFPEYILQETAEKNITHITWEDDEDIPFEISEYSIRPGESRVFESNFSSGTQVVATKDSVRMGK